MFFVVRPVLIQNNRIKMTEIRRKKGNEGQNKAFSLPKCFEKLFINVTHQYISELVGFT